MSVEMTPQSKALPNHDRSEQTKAECQEPCHPDIGCGECADYWQRMIHEKLWNESQKRWTDKGWREMLK